MLEAEPVQVSAEIPLAGHFVRFYDDDAFLLHEVGEFIDSALRCGGTGIVIATADHLEVLRPRLDGFGFAAGQAGWYPGRLVMLDAEATLDRFLVEGWPDEARFQRIIGPLLAEAQRSGPVVHAFGEMVALLCEAGRFEAAMELEAMWNRMADRHAFSLMCAYPSRLFARSERTGAFRHICGAHAHVCRSEKLVDADLAGDGDQLVALWQQKAAALDEEIARRQAAERTLRRREMELADFVENAAEGIHRVAADGTILWANKAELGMLGYTRDEYVGRHIAEFHVDGAVIQDMLLRLAAGQTLYDQPARLRCKDGSIRHVLIHSNGCFENGRLLYTRCFTRDASDRMARLAAEVQRDTVLMHAPVAAALLAGPRHVFRLANPRFCQLAGRDGLAGLAFDDAFPDHGGELPAWLDRIYETGEPHACEEYVGRFGNGTGRCLKLNLEPLRSADGLVEAVIVVAVDITEQVQASRAKDEFLAMLGHELRNPLSPIVTALQLMRMRGEAGSQHEQAVIQRQVDHLVRLVDDLLDISKVTRGKIELQREDARVGDVLAKALEMASLLLEQRRHRVSVEVEPGLRWRGDPVRLAQVVSNLLTNAARYTPPGGDVRLAARRVGDEALEISVADNGIGISAEVLPKVFELFYQAHRTMDRAEGGLGIGLALVKSLVEMHGGTVSAHSDGPGQGSRFTLRLPLGAGASGEAGQAALPGLDAAPAETRSASRARVLLVDDNVDAAVTLGHLLRIAGHEVEVHHDPVSALAAVARFGPTVAVLDIGLPVMDGYELALRMRQQGLPEDCVLVALTGYGQEADRERSRAAGFRHHLVKPVAPDVILELVDQLLVQPLH